MNLPRKFLRIAAARWSDPRSPIRRARTSGAKLLIAALILRRLLRRQVLRPRREHVGLLLPPSVGSVLANTALAIDRRVAVNLNYTVSADVMNQCIAQCGIRHVLTSPRLSGAISAEDRRQDGLLGRPAEEDHPGRQADRGRPGVAAAGIQCWNAGSA